MTARVVVLALAMAAPGAAAAPGLAPSREGGAVTAKIVVTTAVRSEPAGGRVVWRAATRAPWSGGPHVLLVLGSRLDDAGRTWLHVALPIRPNGAQGWIPADRALVARRHWWIDVSTKRRLVSVYYDGRLVRRVRSVVGAPGTPTPHGLFALYDPVRQADPGGFIGPWALHLTAFSNTLDNYGGGPGRIALHGRSGESLNDPLGTARSHGCVRLDNDVIRWLARRVPRGTPVRIS
jgi:lipoprotein-anchoring transpeptidase ErfK/SrfK